jgi:hypothetical protein
MMEESCNMRLGVIDGEGTSENSMISKSRYKSELNRFETISLAFKAGTTEWLPSSIFMEIVPPVKIMTIFPMSINLQKMG